MSALLLRNEKKIRPIEAHRPTLSREELESVLDCLIQDRLSTGSIAQKFEKAFCSTFGYRYAVSVNSLASAYHLAFLAAGLNASDHVLLSALSPVQALDALRYVGANPILVDVGRNSFHPSQEAIESAIAQAEAAGQKITAYILDHTFGSANPLDPLFFKKKGIRLVEDFTGLVGSDVEGQYCGKFGDISVCGLSEFDLLTTGNGGMIVTADQKLYHKLIAMRYGSSRETDTVAYDYGLGDFQAAMGLDQLSKLGITLARRKKIGIKYLETIRSTKHETYFCKPGLDGYLRFPVIINKSKDEVSRYFASVQIGVMPATELPLHHALNLPRMQFANAERIFQKSVAIPVYPALLANNVERIASALRGLV